MKTSKNEQSDPRIWLYKGSGESIPLWLSKTHKAGRITGFDQVWVHMVSIFHENKVLSSHPGANQFFPRLDQLGWLDSPDHSDSERSGRLSRVWKLWWVDNKRFSSTLTLRYCSIALARKPDQGQDFPFHKPQDDIVHMHNSHMTNKDPQIHPSTVFSARLSIRSSHNSCQICLFNHYLHRITVK